MRLKSFVILAAFIFAVSSVSAQDLGAEDSLKLVATGLTIASTQPFEVACSAFVDGTELGLLQFGWRWTTNSATLTMDSAVPSADFDDMELGPFFFLDESLATTNDSQVAFASAVGIVNLFPSSPSWQYVCTYYMTMTNWSGSSSLTIDTIQILPAFGSTEYFFQPVGGSAYKPVWGGPINITPTSVEEVIPGELPSSFQLNQNFPNPFNPSTTISFDLPTRSKVTLKVFNLLGQEVSTLIDKDLPANSYKVEWDGRSESGAPVASGIYFYKLIAEADNNAFVETKKMMLLK
ncbi:MAG: FlgD immunoglobulin-like domain containing protein, partial [candidate division Zixibacteria bacterium]